MSCACGVAMREENVVLVLDGCNSTTGIRAITYNPSALPDADNAGIKHNGGGGFKVSRL